ncbi:MAG: aldo/keto reductase [candidate division NC10 bacterium]|nr:aldo/keto reductase [candidate division NC10 bacterium]
MEYRPFGRTGVMVSPFCLGTLNFGGPTDEGASMAIIERAVAGGINFIDVANSYNKGESERIVGRALKQMGNRDQIFLATKVFNAMGGGPNDRGLSRLHILRECENSLRRLQVDHVDLYQLHRVSFEVPQDETLRALDDLVRAGKVRYFGSSTFPAWKVMEGLAISERLGLNRYVSEQPPYNLLDRRIENELIPLAQAHGLAIMSWSPLAAGVLTGRYPVEGPMPEDSRGARGARVWVERISRSGRQVGEKLAEHAERRGMTAAQLALLWVKEQPGITAPIIGPRTQEHLEAALSVIDKKLEHEDAAFCDSLVPPGSAVVDYHNTSRWMKMRLGGEES